MNYQSTFEQVDAHMRMVDLRACGEGSECHKIVAGAAANPEAAVFEICRVYQTVKPLLELISQLPFLPAKWRDVVKNFIRVMDVLCP